MPEAQLIGQRQRETPGDSRSTPAARRALPPDLLRQASRRLQVLALIGAALWALGPGLGHLAAYLNSPQDPRWGQFGATDAIAVISCLVGLGLYTYLRTRDREPTFILDLALVFMVFCAAGIALLYPPRTAGRHCNWTRSL